MNVLVIYAALALGIVLAGVAFFFVGRSAGKNAEHAAQVAGKATAEESSKRILDDAAREAEALRKAAVVAGKEETIKLRESWELEAQKRRDEIERGERRVQERDTNLDRKLDILDQREKEVSKRLGDLGAREKVVLDRQAEVEKLGADARRRLEQLAGMSAQDAKAEMISRLAEEAHADAANQLREIRESARRNAEREAKKIVALAVQRIASEHTSEISVSSVSLPNDEMKGRIIG